MNKIRKSGFIFLAVICIFSLLQLYQFQKIFRTNYLSLLGSVSECDMDTAIEAFQSNINREDSKELTEKGEKVLQCSGYAVTGELFLREKNRIYFFYVMTGVVIVFSILSCFWLTCQLKDREKSIESEKTLRMEAILQTEQLERKLEDMESHMNEFMGNIYHQLKTPVTNLKLCMEFYMEAEDEESARQNSLQQIERMSALLTLLLKEGQLQMNKVRFHYQSCMLEELLQDVVVSALLFAKEKHIQLELEKDNEELLISCDEIWLSEAFEAILQNCIEHTENTSIVQIKVKKVGRYGEITIYSGGEKISKEAQKRIFERYYTEKKQGEHFGIGMHMAKTVIERHFGSIQVRTEEKSSVVFCIVLPLLSGGEAYTVT